MQDVLPDRMKQEILTKLSDLNRQFPPKTTSDKVYNAALACNQTLVCPFQDLNFGHLACAFAVNRVVEFATGKPIDNSINTASLFSTLLHSKAKQVAVHSPGNIIISPTVGDIHGHVGVFGENALIYSNSSVVATLGVFLQNYDLESWKHDLEGQRGLKTYVFALD